ncbi:MAG: YafY family transcriptional regulator [bacterium]|nr:YafY family transcriptional regulator [bacterium]
MRRADRLFQIIQILRLRRITTAAHLARELDVSERTIYRDVRDLILSGVPIEGEAGLGYALRRGFDLPPLMFTGEEIEALVLGARTVGEWSDPELKSAANNALRKIETILPDHLRKRLKSSALFSHNFIPSTEVARTLPVLRTAVRKHRKIRYGYQRLDGESSTRTVRPLCLTFFGKDWLLTAWCELRRDYRNFRIDRIVDLHMLEEVFEEGPGCSLQEFMAGMVNQNDRRTD